MLLAQYGRRCQERCLKTVSHGLIHRPEGELCLAEADIAADEAIHDALRFHVRLDLLQRLQLVLGFLIGEERFKLLLPERISGEGMPAASPPLGIECDQVSRQLFDSIMSPRLLALPLRTAQA